MADNKVSNDLFEAINIITQKALQSVNFNATKKCTITDNTNAKNGTYGVSDGTTSFIAYSQDTTYRLNDTVQVLIPNNDFNQQKMIIGKWKNEDDNKPYNYQAPFDLMIDMTQNIIDSPISGELIANDRANATDTLENTWNEENHLDNTQTSGGSWRTIYYKSFLDNPLVGYTRLGLAADFRTLISAVEGNFGLRLTVGSNQNNALIAFKDFCTNCLSYINQYNINGYDKTKGYQSIKTSYNQLITYIDSNKLEDILNPQQESGNRYSSYVLVNIFSSDINIPFLYSWIIDVLTPYNSNDQSIPQISFLNPKRQAEDVVHDIVQNTPSLSFVSYLDATDMIGNIYNSTIGTRQEKVFDISSLGPIYYISLDLYEEIGTFFDITPEGEMIFTPYLQTETGAESIDTQGNWGIETNDRVGQNIFVDNCYICLGYEQSYFTQESAFLYHNDSNTYNNTIETKQVFLRWAHKTKNGNFIIVNESTELDKEYTIYWYQQDYSYAGDQYSGNYWKKLEDFDNQFFCSFTPRYDTYQQEKIKCVILYDSNVIQSNSVIYDNTANTLQVLSTTLNRGLNIVCGDRSGGIYPIYDEHFESIKPAAASSLYAVMNDKALDVQVDINDLLPIDGIDSVIWEVPVKNSLLTFYWDGNLVTSSNDTTMIGNNSATGESADNLNKLTYMISSRYNPNYTNNTVKCTVIKDGQTYQTSLAFTFGLASTNGYPYALTIACINSSKPVLYTDIENILQFQIHCYDLNNNMSEVEAESITCKLNDETLTPQNNIITISKSDVSITTFYILHITYTFNDITLTKDVPIPVQKYGSNDNDYINNTAPYIYYNTDGSLSNKAGLTFKHTASSGNYGFLLFKNSANCGYISDNFIGKMQNNTFAPVSQYIDNVEQFGVAYGPINNGSIGSVDVVWQCPIIKEQYRYPYTAINEWNGMDISLNEGTGTILAPRLGAGKKVDGQFSGVILGDWASQSEIDGLISGQTGIYGMQNGAISYAFKDDGTAFIGKSGTGRIQFDGTRGTITSNRYIISSGTTGMLIDLKDGKIDMTNNAGHITLDTTNNNSLFKITNSANTALINIGSTYYLQSHNYVANTSGTKINLTDGKLETNDGTFRGTIYATEGVFEGSLSCKTISCPEATAYTKTLVTSSLTMEEGGSATIDNINGETLNYTHITVQTLYGKQNRRGDNITTISCSLTLTASIQAVDNLGYWILSIVPLNSNNWDKVTVPQSVTIKVTDTNNTNNSQTFTFPVDSHFIEYSTLVYLPATSVKVNWTNNQKTLSATVNEVSSATVASIIGRIVCASDFEPAENGKYLLGSSGWRWKAVYADNVYQSSSRSLKNTIQPFTINQNNFFDNLKPKTFIYNNDKMMHKGFIIDEVCAAAASAQLNPEDCGVMFSTDEKDPNDPNASLCYNDFIALNTWQIQLLKKRVQTLEDKIKQLEAKLNEN